MSAPHSPPGSAHRSLSFLLFAVGVTLYVEGRQCEGVEGKRTASSTLPVLSGGCKVDGTHTPPPPCTQQVKNKGPPHQQSLEGRAGEVILHTLGTQYVSADGCPGKPQPPRLLSDQSVCSRPAGSGLDLGLGFSAHFYTRNLSITRYSCFLGGRSGGGLGQLSQPLHMSNEGHRGQWWTEPWAGAQ